MKLYTKKFDELNTHELYQILQLRAEVFIVEQNCAYQDIDSRDIKSLHLIAVSHDAIIGYCRILPTGIAYDQYCSIGRVVVKKNLVYINMVNKLCKLQLIFVKHILKNRLR